MPCLLSGGTEDGSKASKTTQEFRGSKDSFDNNKMSVSVLLEYCFGNSSILASWWF